MRSTAIADNARLNEREVAAGALVLASRPRVVFVELSRRCNLACWMCHRFTLDRGSFVDMGDALVDKLRAELFPTAEVVDLHGLGESTLHPRFNALCREIYDGGSRVRVVTNMNGLTAETRATLVDVDAMLCFSLSALGQEKYRRIYARGNFDDLAASLRSLAELRRASGRCADMRCMSMLYEPNLDDLGEVMRFVRDHDVKRLHAWPMFLKPGDKRYVGNDLGRWTETIARAFDLADELDMELRIIDWPVPPAGATKVLERSGCRRPWTHVMINVDGQVGLCDYNEHVDAFAGLNVGERPFMDVWNHPHYVKARRDFLAGQPAATSGFCGDVCSKTKYVDFDDSVFPELGSRVLNNRQRAL